MTQDELYGDVLNLTQHVMTPEQGNAGVVEPRMTKERIQALLTFEEIPSKAEIEARAKELARLAAEEASMYSGETENYVWITKVMIGGAPYLMPALEKAILECPGWGFRPVYAFSKRTSEEVPQPDGSVRKVQVFRHAGFVEV